MSGRGSYNRGGKVNWNSTKPQCQVCGKHGHTALECWHRFDQEFQPSHSQSIVKLL